MIGRWGMSDAIGPVSIDMGSGDDNYAMPFANGGPSEQTRALIDSETRRLIDSCEVEASAIIRSHEDKLDGLVKALLEHETLNEADAYRIANVEHSIVKEAAFAVPVDRPNITPPSAAQ